MALRVKIADIGSRFLTIEPFTTGGTLNGVKGAVSTVASLPRNFRRLYRHHVSSGNFTVLFTVVSGETIVAWVVLSTDPLTGAQTRKYIVPVYETANRSVLSARKALIAA